MLFEVEDITSKYVTHPSELGRYFYEELEPIPLTEEWLLKFGFKEDGHYNSAKRWMGIFNQPLIQCNGYFTIPNYFSTEIKYVHTLQNLYFALTCEELTIKE